MKFKAQLEVIGMRAFKDTVEGKAYDFTKFYVLVEVDESKGRSVGLCGKEYEVGSATVFEQFKTYPLPFKVDCDMELFTNHKGVNEVKVLTFNIVGKPPIAKAA